MKILILKSFAVFWAIVTALGALVLILFFGALVVLTSLAVLAASLERRHLRAIVRLPPGQRTVPTQVQNLTAEAEARGYQQIGIYSAKLGLARTRITLLLSSDAQILLLLPYDRSGPQLITRLTSGQWFLTGPSILPDLSGLDEVELIDGDFDAVEAGHRDRLTASETGISIFDPATFESDLLEHMREQVRRLYSMGFVRYLDPDRTSWIYNAQGAWKLTRVAVAKITRRNKDVSLTETEAKVRSFRRRRFVQRFAMLQALWLLPGSAAFKAAFPEWVAAFPAWIDSAMVAISTLSVVAAFASAFVGFRCPVCKTSLSDEDGSLLLFATIETCSSCGTAIDMEKPQDELAGDRTSAL